jgi:HK97 gp10 family phage protein
MMRVQVTGLDELRQMFDVLPDTMRRKFFRRALRKGARQLAAAIAQAAPIRTEPGEKRTARGARGPGYLKRNITVRGLRSRNGAPAFGVTLARDAWYGQIVESGHGPPRRGRRRRGGLRRLEYGGRSTPPTPFIRPTVVREGPRTVQLVIDTLRQELTAWNGRA